MNGDGSTSRDFCYIANVVQANLLAAAVASNSPVINGVVNIACGATTSLNQLQEMLRVEISRVKGFSSGEIPAPRYAPFRKGDIAHSLANIDLAKSQLGYHPSHSVAEGLAELVQAELGVG